MRPHFGSTGSLRFARSSQAFFYLLVVLSFLPWAPPASTQSDALTLPRNLAQLVDESELIVQGRVTSVTLEPHAQLNNLQTVVVTLQVEETLKGAAPASYTFRQAAIGRREQQQMMGYRVGQRLLLTLIRPSFYGLSSPAGMQQGRFSIAAGPNGKLHASNGVSNAGLFRGLETQLQASGTHISPEIHGMIAQQKTEPLPLDQLKILIRSIATRNSPQ
jgi:hypothetical protein